MDPTMPLNALKPPPSSLAEDNAEALKPSPPSLGKDDAEALELLPPNLADDDAEALEPPPPLSPRTMTSPSSRRHRAATLALNCRPRAAARAAAPSLGEVDANALKLTEVVLQS